MANSEVFHLYEKYYRKRWHFLDYNNIIILKVNVYRFNVNPKDISGNFDRLINKGKCIDFEFS